MCVLDETIKCDGCGECDRCDLDPNKICDNCGACLDAYNTNEKVKDIHKDIKSIQKDISNLFSTASSIEQQLKDINSTLSTHSDYKEFEEKMESLSKDLRVIKWFFAPFALYDSYEE